MRKPIPRGRDGSSSQPSSHALYPLASLLLLKPLITFCCPFFFSVNLILRAGGLYYGGPRRKREEKTEWLMPGGQERARDITSIL